MGEMDLGKWSEGTALLRGEPVTRSTRKVEGAPKVRKSWASRRAEEDIDELSRWQEALYAEGKRGVLFVLQGLDTAGKDGTIRHIFQGVNPQGVSVAPFKVPTPQESAHDFLFRIHQQVPSRGMIGVFNRSHYEDLLVPLATESISEAEYRRRVEVIEGFERYLTGEGIVIVKCFLHVSYEVQGQRLLRRLDRQDKHWKFSASDVATRDHWDVYSRAYQRVIPDTSFEGSPWHVIPADRKWYRNWVARAVLLQQMRTLSPQLPKVSIDHIDRLRRELRAGLEAR